MWHLSQWQFALYERVWIYLGVNKTLCLLAFSLADTESTTITLPLLSIMYHCITAYTQQLVLYLSLSYMSSVQPMLALAFFLILKGMVCRFAIYLCTMVAVLFYVDVFPRYIYFKMFSHYVVRNVIYR